MRSERLLRSSLYVAVSVMAPACRRRGAASIRQDPGSTLLRPSAPEPGRGYDVQEETYGGAMVSTWSILRQSCKPRSPVGLVKQPETKSKCGEPSRTRCLA